MRRLFFLALFWRAARTVDVYYYWVGSVSDPATACVFEHEAAAAVAAVYAGDIAAFGYACDCPVCAIPPL